ncbi:hypothetical protein HDU97_003004 [Phlyctochytrium planicorne]|nr:hypothetical protein HDU97_003004 [Phlyctochytrium planicorne]
MHVQTILIALLSSSAALVSALPPCTKKAPVVDYNSPSSSVAPKPSPIDNSGYTGYDAPKPIATSTTSSKVNVEYGNGGEKKTTSTTAISTATSTTTSTVTVISSTSTVQTTSTTTSTTTTSSCPTPKHTVKQCTGTPKMTRLGGYETGVFEKGASEIVAYDANRKRMLITNADAKTVDVIDISNPTKPQKLKTFSAQFPNANAINSVDVYDNLAAVAVEGVVKTDPGHIEFWDLTTDTFISSVTICSQPDSVVFSPNGKWVLAPCEGEPNDDYSVDPEGNIAIIDISQGPLKASYKAADFKKFNSPNTPPGVRIGSKAATAANDIEPEYIAISSDSKKAYVSLQENNALAVVDIASATVEKVFPLGLKNHTISGLDVNDKDGKIDIRTWNNVVGMYMPDTIAYYEDLGACQVSKGEYVITANEGDGRTYGPYSDEFRAKDLALDPAFFPKADATGLARLTVSSEDGYTLVDGKKVYQKLHAFGARSFSIWNAKTGEQVYDSGDAFEQITAAAEPKNFNSNHNEAKSFDNRSDNKGPEPEALKVGQVGQYPILFVGLERQSGILMYDLTDVKNPKFIQYINNRNFDAAITAQGDLGPEGFDFVYSDESPTGNALLLVGNEISGSTAVFEITC